MTTTTEHARQMAERDERRLWTDKVDAIRPSYDRRMMTTQRTGTCADAGYSTSEYALCLRRPSGTVTTLAACRFDTPARTVARYLREMAR